MRYLTKEFFSIDRKVFAGMAAYISCPTEAGYPVSESDDGSLPAEVRWRNWRKCVWRNRTHLSTGRFNSYTRDDGITKSNEL